MTVQACPVNRDCVMNDWVLGACSVTCGTGTRHDTRTVQTPASGTGTACPTDLDRTVECVQPVWTYIIVFAKACDEAAEHLISFTFVWSADALFRLAPSIVTVS